MNRSPLPRRSRCARRIALALTIAFLYCGISPGLSVLPGGGPGSAAQAQPAPAAEVSEAPELPIAVLSPSGNPVLDRVGDDHVASADAVLGMENGRIEAGGREYVLRVHHLRGIPSESGCRRRARRAVEELGAVAILGPVTSGCTRAVLSASGEVPVITSLATATELDTAETGRLFRTIAHDRRRLSRYVRVIRRRPESPDISGGVALYENSVYGRGLREHVQVQAQIESDHTYRWDAVVDEAASTHDEIVFTESFRAEMRTHGHEIPTVFVLGADRATAIVRALSGLFASVAGDPSFVLVGSTGGAELPNRTRVVGEPRASESTDLVSRLARELPLERLYVSTLDAGLVVRQALVRVLGSEGAGGSSSAAGPGTIDGAELRRNLGEVLAEGSFHSSERFRTIQFDGGEVSEPPTTPIYEVTVQRVRSVINAPEPTPWVEIRVVRRPDHHGEGPVVAEVIPHGEELVGQTVTLQATGSGSDPIFTSDPLVLREEGMREAFVPMSVSDPFPERVTLRTEWTPAGETAEVRGIGWPISYLLAALFAVAAAALFTRYRSGGGDEAEEGASSGLVDRAAIRIYGERCAAGIVIAFVILHLEPLLDPPGMEATSLFSQLPIPRFDASWWMNAALSGLLGGWLGLKFIVGLVAGVISSLAPLFRQGEG